MTFSPFRLGAVALTLGLTSLVAIPGCSSASSISGQLDCSISAKGKALVTAVGNLSTVADAMTLQVATSCFNIATAGGMGTMWTPMSNRPPTTDEVTNACDAANAVITKAQADAQGSFSLVVVGSFGCEADVTAQGSCDATCSGDVSCMGGDISASCDPGMISGQCSGTCMAGATCEGTPDLKVDCQGSCTGACDGMLTGGGCDGSCTGTCAGTCKGDCTVNGMVDAANSQGKGMCMGSCSLGCSGSCMGTCTKPSASASCTGKCSGSCKVTGPNVMCSAGASCTGGCSVAVTAPSCKGKITPPKCMADAQCQGSCQASAQATAKCTYPTVQIAANSSVNASIITVLTAEIPKLILVATVQAKALVSVVGDVTTSIEAAISTSAACAAQLPLFIAASANIQVSFSASASVSGKASGG